MRSIYSPAYFGVDRFQEFQKRFQAENVTNSGSKPLRHFWNETENVSHFMHQYIEKIKSLIKESLTKSDAKILSDDLKSYLYLAQTDDEVNTLIEAIKKWYMTLNHYYVAYIRILISIECVQGTKPSRPRRCSASTSTLL